MDKQGKIWDRFAKEPWNERQVKMLNKLLDGFEGKLTTSKWAKIAKCSQDSAYRDILDLTTSRAGVLTVGEGVHMALWQEKQD